MITRKYRAKVNPLLYSIYLGMAYLISSIPLTVFYGISNILYLLTYRVLKYRLKVVRKNLKYAFPEKKLEERRAIERKFYRHFCNVLVETLKLFSFSAKSIRERCPIIDVEKLDFAYEKTQGILCATAHYGNWEWMGLAASQQLKQDFAVIYQRIKNPYFHKLMAHMRSRMNVRLIEKHETVRTLAKLRRKNMFVATLADQTPDHGNAHFMKWFGKKSYVFKGPEKLAKSLKWILLFAYSIPVGKGRYEIRYKILTTDVSRHTEMEMTELYNRELEAVIRKNPEYWLWTHKRWKYNPDFHELSAEG